MTNKKEIYKCEVCENVIEVTHSGKGELVCCGEPMKKLKLKTEDKGVEKHLPVIEAMPAKSCEGKDGYEVRVGEREHPMEEKHFIEWIEINTKSGKSGKKFLTPEDKPKAIFQTREEIESIRVYCNIHGLWIKNL